MCIRLRCCISLGDAVIRGGRECRRHIYGRRGFSASVTVKKQMLTIRTRRSGRVGGRRTVANVRRWTIRKFGHVITITLLSDRSRRRCTVNT